MHDPFEEQLRICKDAPMVAGCLLEKAITFSGTSMGNVQLLSHSNILKISAQKGFGDAFLNAFHEVACGEDSVCAKALKRREAVTVADVTRVKELSPYHPVFAKAGVRAVRSVPLISRGGVLTGMVSVHFPEPQDLGLAELVTLSRFATLAAEKLVCVSPDDPNEVRALTIPSRKPSKENLKTWAKLRVN